MNELGIQEGKIIEAKLISEEVLCSDILNSLVDDWVKTWWSKKNEEVDFDKIYKKGEKQLKSICPEKMLELLKDPRNTEGPHIKWKGKLIPEGFVKNIPTTNDTDYLMVKEFGHFKKSTYYNSSVTSKDQHSIH